MDLDDLYDCLRYEPRRKVLQLLLESGDRTVAFTSFKYLNGLSQPTMTHHVGQLRRAGLVFQENHGLYTFFGIEPEKKQLIADCIGAFDRLYEKVK